MKQLDMQVPLLFRFTKPFFFYDHKLIPFQVCILTHPKDLSISFFYEIKAFLHLYAFPEFSYQDCMYREKFLNV